MLGVMPDVMHHGGIVGQRWWLGAAVLLVCGCRAQEQEPEELQDAQQAQECPAKCQGSTGIRGYSAGMIAGQSLINQAWAGITQSCTRIHELKAALENTLGSANFPPNPESTHDSLYLACNYAGRIDGMMQRLNELLDACAAVCCTWGDEIGVFYGQVYCVIATTIGVNDPGEWLRPPVWFCADHYQSCCDDAFIATARDQCLPYVVSPHAIAFDHVRQMTCTFK
jgi:hypothetical protein